MAIAIAAVVGGAVVIGIITFIIIRRRRRRRAAVLREEELVQSTMQEPLSSAPEPFIVTYVTRCRFLPGLEAGGATRSVNTVREISVIYDSKKGIKVNCPFFSSKICRSPKNLNNPCIYSKPSIQLSTVRR